MSQKPIINIAILAHVDAGKTTLTEQLLFESGQLKNRGDVNKGTATSDFLSVEKQRGISVISSNVGFDYNNVHFNIIDTPGHADFISEVERSLYAVDVVLLMISAADGVQAQTKVLWKMLKKLGIPTVVVLNKIDRDAIFFEEVISSIRTDLDEQILPIQEIIENDDSVEITCLRDYNNNGTLKQNDDILETISNIDDNIMEKYLQGDSIDNEELKTTYKNKIAKSELFPLMFSAAKTAQGINNILDELINLFANVPEEEEEFSAVVFKVQYQKDQGKICFLRIFSGKLNKKQVVYNQSQDFEEKVNQIKSIFSDKFTDVNDANTNEIVAVTGLSNSMVGDVLGKIKPPRDFNFDNQTVLTVAVKEENEDDYLKLSEALSILTIEDPRLNFKWYKEEHEFTLNINGWIQIQILEQIILDRFGIIAKFESPQVIYKETPSKSGFGIGHYTMPKPCWAEIKLKIEPGEQGSGLVYNSTIGVNDALLKYQKEVERTVPRALEQGIKGWEVTDLKITLVGATDHVVHSRAGDFVIVTPMGVMNGLNEIGTDLLEPIMSFEINAPDSLLGQISSDLHNMRATFSQPHFNGNDVVIKGEIPTATSLEYPVQLASRSGGKASILMQFLKYQKVEAELGVIRDYRGISPLDRSKYILKMRNAIK